ncbi:MAG: hypothetical protein EOO39_47290 [Cytophagaceae bacterium]|nr:MAG: hypothetical protein EOO39_47290 [Cytophagaceae bacterium]
MPGLGISLTASGKSNTFGAASATTDANGQFTTTLGSPVALNRTIIATFGNSSTVATVVTFVPWPASTTTSSLVVNSKSTIANNSNTLTAVLTLRDSHDNPFAGVMPSFSGSAPSTTVTASDNTAASGQASG